ncbi:MAG: hypothetical protein ACLGGX_07025 [Bdellovibrionia bacterium]
MLAIILTLLVNTVSAQDLARFRMPVSADSSLEINYPHVELEVEALDNPQLEIAVNDKKNVKVLRIGKKYRIEAASDDVLALGPNVPLVKVILKGPSLNLSVHSFKSKIQIQKWRHPLQVSGVNTELMILNHQSGVQVFATDVNLSVNGGSGFVKVKSQNLGAKVQKSASNIELRQHKAKLELLESSGSVFLDGKTVDLFSAGHSGHMELKVDSGSVELQKMIGHGEIQSENVKYKLQLEPLSRVDIVDKSSRFEVLRIQPLQVELSTESGAIQGDGIKPYRLNGNLEYKGRAQQGTQPGILKINTLSGKIIFK